MVKAYTRKPGIYLNLIFFILIFIFGWVNYYYLKKVDESYSKLVVESIDHSNSLSQTIANTASVLEESYRLANISGNNLSKKDLYKFDSLEIINKRLFLSLQNLNKEKAQQQKFNELIILGLNSEKERNQFIALITHQKKKEAWAFLNLHFSVTLHQYLQKQLEYTDEARKSTLDTSSQIRMVSERIYRLNQFLGWIPVAIFLILLLIAVLVFYLLNSLTKELEIQ